MSKQQILPSNTLNSLELTLPGQNSAGKALHPLQQAPKTLAEMEDAAMFNRALQVGGRGFAMGLKMERLQSVRPKVPGRSLRTLGGDILSGRLDDLQMEDYIGEVEGSERYFTHAYPM